MKKKGRTLIKFNCTECGKEGERTKYHMSTSTNHFCSNECAILFRTDGASKRKKFTNCSSCGEDISKNNIYSSSKWNSSRCVSCQKKSKEKRIKEKLSRRIKFVKLFNESAWKKESK